MAKANTSEKKRIEAWLLACPASDPDYWSDGLDEFQAKAAEYVGRHRVSYSVARDETLKGMFGESWLDDMEEWERGASAMKRVENKVKSDKMQRAKELAEIAVEGKALHLEVPDDGFFDGKEASHQDEVQWVMVNIQKPPKSIKAATCPSEEAWTMLLTYIDDPKAFIKDLYYKTVTGRGGKASQDFAKDAASFEEMLESCGRDLTRRTRVYEAIKREAVSG